MFPRRPHSIASSRSITFRRSLRAPTSPIRTALSSISTSDVAFTSDALSVFRATRSGRGSGSDTRRGMLRRIRSYHAGHAASAAPAALARAAISPRRRLPLHHERHRHGIPRREARRAAFRVRPRRALRSGRRPHPARPARKLARRRDVGWPPRPERIHARDGLRGRHPQRAHRPREGHRRARHHVLHPLRQPQGARARGEPARLRRPLLERARAPGAHRRRRRASHARRVGGLFPLAPARQPARRLGLQDQSARRREPRGPRRQARRARGAAWRGAGSAPGVLGWVPPLAALGGALAGAPEPDARPPPLCAQRAAASAGGSSASRRRPRGDQRAAEALRRRGL